MKKILILLCNDGKIVNNNGEIINNFEENDNKDNKDEHGL